MAEKWIFVTSLGFCLWKNDCFYRWGLIKDVLNCKIQFTSGFCGNIAFSYTKFEYNIYIVIYTIRLLEIC